MLLKKEPTYHRSDLFGFQFPKTGPYFNSLIMSTASTIQALEVVKACHGLVQGTSLFVTDADCPGRQIFCF